ncbi:MAG: hypothetical protein Q8927_05315 [Bacteroidota bacterium]|nr:hypothetical protein [Bacteroidota bacterium]MDP4215600.1 hypothetical protein [Bacteroidota bacterium]MDP4246151.1 hypothetical protein [Bacteroidota bacterium]MDP4255965.1 hypothetical protein [Bacteroidota bacterium]MDP4259548.1 hypothetical protein [Bacteroidota bacterium]
MFGDKDINFITRGMERLGTAIFSNESRSILRLPTSIIKIAGIDTGLVWFTARAPYEDLNGLDRTFPAQLQFYRKYFDYYIVADGDATIILDGNECRGIGSTYIPVTGRNGDLVIRFKVIKAEYVNRSNKPAGLLTLLLSPFAQ